MKLSDIIALLRTTIAAKVRLLESLETSIARVPTVYHEVDQVQRAVDKATAGFLKLNINELKKILVDLEQVNEI